ncbi:MAG TPA: mechanosensitive ion channel domain-containing protein [Ramlibacter sp.]|uniref:mechanosensitive ion channel family protein n=1 Tax=Ramlibacter sp. TaxID=1917967 RepID=UPI002C0619DC|nr:mechanosensitive ion channel domain-containing protein [Ramlibacter sp.]HVZ42970.1 mechanosensitive ion channel domain-containing protein [Ramlibacter sp.]
MTELSQLLDQHSWSATLVVALVAVLVAIALHRVGGILLRRVARYSAFALTVLRALDRPAGAVLPSLALLMVWGLAPDQLPYLARVEHFTVLLLVVALTWLGCAAVAGLAKAIIEQHPVTTSDNLQARRVLTQTRVLSRSATTLVLIAGASLALMTFPGARQVGASLLASAGVIGIVGGLAARPVFSNLIAGLQIALSQPIRLDDVLIVQGEWGRVEEITGTYVVLKIWDERRLIVPLQWFIENPFQNWTRTSAQILGSVMLWVDYATPVEAIRAEAKRVAESASEWDGRVFSVQVSDTTDRAMQVRVLVSSADSGKSWDLRCKLREALLAFLAREHPQCLPVARQENRGEAAPSRGHLTTINAQPGDQGAS